VGFEVAYLYRGGKFEGQEREVSNSTNLTLFLCKRKSLLAKKTGIQ
jgi:hypothetical protein